MYMFLTSNVIYSLSISLLSVKETENYIYKRQERNTEKERDSESKRMY